MSTHRHKNTVIGSFNHLKDAFDSRKNRQHILKKLADYKQYLLGESRLTRSKIANDSVLADIHSIVQRYIKDSRLNQKHFGYAYNKKRGVREKIKKYYYRARKSQLIYNNSAVCLFHELFVIAELQSLVKQIQPFPQSKLEADNSAIAEAFDTGHQLTAVLNEYVIAPAADWHTKIKPTSEVIDLAVMFVNFFNAVNDIKQNGLGVENGIIGGTTTLATFNKLMNFLSEKYVKQPETLAKIATASAHIAEGINIINGFIAMSVGFKQYKRINHQHRIAMKYRHQIVACKQFVQQHSEWRYLQKLPSKIINAKHGAIYNIVDGAFTTATGIAMTAILATASGAAGPVGWAFFAASLVSLVGFQVYKVTHSLRKPMPKHAPRFCITTNDKMRFEMARRMYSIAAELKAYLDRGYPLHHFKGDFAKEIFILFVTMQMVVDMRHFACLDDMLNEILSQGIYGMQNILKNPGQVDMITPSHRTVHTPLSIAPAKAMPMLT